MKAFMNSTLTEKTLPQVLALQAERLGSGSTAIREKAFGIWQCYSWRIISVM